MANIFVSYNRQTKAITKALVDDVEALGHTVWFDQELSGGQAWWDQILSMIRRCDLFVFILDPAALNSIACKREYGYAADLRKPILPILVSEGVSTNLLPPSLSQIEFVDYRNQDRTAALRLARAFSSVPPPAALPDPLPVPPEAPLSYLGSLAAKLETTSLLTYEEQSVLVFDLRRGLRDPETADDTRTLLKAFRKRRDLLASIAEEIDELFKALRETSSAQAAPLKLEQMAEPKFQEPQGPNVATPPERESREQTERGAARLAREKRKAAELAELPVENRRAAEAARLAEDQKALQAKFAEEKRKSAQSAERMRPVTKSIWWVPMLRGIAAIVFGVIVFADLSGFLLPFGAWLLVDGVFRVVGAFRGRAYDADWGFYLMIGIVGIIMGFLTFLRLGNWLVLSIYIAPWTLMIGTSEIAGAIKLRREIIGQWLLILMGLASVVFAMLLLWNPLLLEFEDLHLLFFRLTPSYAIVFGVLGIIFGFRLRSLRTWGDGRQEGSEAWIETLKRNWWVPALRGVAAIIFGIIAFTDPAMATLVLAFGAWVLVDGIFRIIGAITHRASDKEWGFDLIIGMLGIIIGFLTFHAPRITLLALIIYIAAWALMIGATEIALAIKLRREIKGEWFLILMGVTSILFVIMLLLIPLGALALVWLIGSYAIVFGILGIILGFRLRSLPTLPVR